MFCLEMSVFCSTKMEFRGRTIFKVILLAVLIFLVKANVQDCSTEKCTQRGARVFGAVRHIGRKLLSTAPSEETTQSTTTHGPPTSTTYPQTDTSTSPQTDTTTYPVINTSTSPEIDTTTSPTLEDNTTISDILGQNNLNPSNAGSLENIENLLAEIARQVPEDGITQSLGNAHLYIKPVNLEANQSKLNLNLELGSTRMDFTLQTGGVRQVIVAALSFKTDTTETAQTQPIEAGSLATTRYKAVENTTFTAIEGWDADSLLSSTTAGNDQLLGKAQIVVPPTSTESVCKEIEAEKKNTSNLMINKLQPICLFFDRVARKYSDRGCITITDDVTGNVTCKCNHLTTFTVLLAVKTVAIPSGVKITSYITESVTLLTLIVTIAILYKHKQRDDRVPVQINLSVALLLLHAVNLSHDLAVMHDVSCVIVTITNHYCLLCTEIWFLVEGVRLFMATSNPIKFQTTNPKKRLKIFMLIGWIIPALIVGISMAVGFPLGNYMKPQPLYEQCNEFFPIPKYNRCWLAPGTPIFHATVIAPLALVLLINFIIIVKTTHVMLHSRRKRKRGEDPGLEDALRAVKSFIFLFFLLGGTWILAFFTGIGNEITNEVFMYINAVVNGSQGIVVFLLYCVMDDVIRVRLLSWKRNLNASFGVQMTLNTETTTRG